MVRILLIIGAGLAVAGIGSGFRWAPDVSSSGHEAVGSALQRAEEAGVQWRTGLASARLEAERTRRPLLAVFR